MDRFARLVLGYHGCDPTFADALISGTLRVADWKPSENPYDWLGRGIYFWEHAPERALAWSKGGVVGALIQLGTCLDLTDVAYTKLLEGAYQSLEQIRLASGEPMPKNKAKRRDLDCLVINELFASADRDGLVFQSVRCPFLEGEPAFPGSAIFRESHVQIAVRDPGCIVGVFRPT